jgi:hypothetical protein
MKYSDFNEAREAARELCAVSQKWTAVVGITERGVEVFIPSTFDTPPKPAQFRYHGILAWFVPEPIELSGAELVAEHRGVMPEPCNRTLDAHEAHGYCPGWGGAR